MAGARNKWLIILNDFSHDLFSGFWMSCILVLYVLDRKADAAGGLLLASELREVMALFFWLVISSLAVVLITGIMRSITYRRERDEDTEQVKKKMLIIKHVFLGAVFSGGTWLAYSLTFR
ncbi:MAG TPA: hypothetical protein DCO77_01895 [Nitrospiraceae bacterium]|nr:hypothetical protein [Nitrospiraceae bacterium]